MRAACRCASGARVTWSRTSRPSSAWHPMASSARRRTRRFASTSCRPVSTWTASWDPTRGPRCSRRRAPAARRSAVRTSRRRCSRRSSRRLEQTGAELAVQGNTGAGTTVGGQVNATPPSATTPTGQPNAAPPTTTPVAGSCSSATISAPVKGTVTSPYGPRGGRNHDGMDIAAPTGTPVHAAACGTVSLAGQQSGYGNIVCVTHTSQFSTCYAHLSRFGVSNGAQVQQGQVIGYVGCTGSCTGPHVHFETRVNGQAQNPTTYLGGASIPGKRATVAGASTTSGTKASTTATAAVQPASAESVQTTTTAGTTTAGTTTANDDDRGHPGPRGARAERDSRGRGARRGAGRAGRGRDAGRGARPRCRPSRSRPRRRSRRPPRCRPSRSPSRRRSRRRPRCRPSRSLPRRRSPRPPRSGRAGRRRGSGCRAGRRLGRACRGHRRGSGPGGRGRYRRRAVARSARSGRWPGGSAEPRGNRGDPVWTGGVFAF